MTYSLQSSVQYSEVILCERTSLRKTEHILAAVYQPLPSTHLICRATSVTAGKCWMDALELSLERKPIRRNRSFRDGSSDNKNYQSGDTSWQEFDTEAHFDDHGGFKLHKTEVKLHLPIY